MKKRAGRSNLRANHIAIAVAAAFTPWSVYGQTPPPNQMPNVAVTAGTATVNAPVGTFLNIDQASQRAIYEGSLTMGANAHMNLQHAFGRSGIGLFRDVTGSQSQIFGRITSNGQVFISNQNGVLFGSTARVDVGGLFATSLSITDGDFMSGRYQWFNAGGAGSVTNQGEIIAPTGYAVLAGPQVRNDGVIVARTGTVTLAAGDRVTLDLIGDGLISVSVDQAALNASVINTGTIEAEGGTVRLTARSANALLDTVVNAGGVIRASSLIERNGEIVLDGGGGGTMVAGTVDARNVTVAGRVINETPDGRIIADTLTTTSVVGTSLTGQNQVSVLNASGGTDFVFANTGDLTVASLFGGNVEIHNQGAVAIAGPWSTSGTISIATTGADADLTVLNTLMSFGRMELDVGGTLRVAATGSQNVFLQNQSVGGQDITARAVEVSASGGRIAQIVNFGGDQTITATAGGVDVQASGPGSSASILNQAGIRQTVNAAGGVRLRSQNGGTAQIGHGGSGDQSVNVSSGGLSLVAEGGFAGLTTQLSSGGNQTISVSGGDGIDLRATNNGNVSVGQAAAGRSQTILVTDADHINLNAVSGGVVISAGPGTTQNISITGSGANAITIGSQGALGTSQIVGNRQQVVTAGAEGQRGSITITGPDANSRAASIFTSPVADGTQTLSTAGTLRVTGGRANQASNFSSGVFHNGSGAQTVNAARIELEGGASGTNNAVFISSNGGGVPANGGAQTINVTGDIVINGGAGGNASIVGPAARLQTIRAANIHLTNAAAGGINSTGLIVGGHQDIRATGNVTLTARASGGDLPGVRIGGNGGPTDLDLYVGGDLILTGGTAQNNGASIGSSGAGTAFANDIYIETGGRVVLNSGTQSNTHARIGSSAANGTAGGNIEIHAGGGIEMAGASSSAAAIRTLGNVTLDAASVTQTGNSFILADTLTVTTGGAASLAGPNDVARFNATSGGPLTFVDAGGLRVTGVSTTNDTITLTTDSLTNEGVITNGGGTSTANIVLSADAFNLAGGSVEGGAAAVILRPRTGTNSFGIEGVGQTTLTNADIASIHTTDFVVFGSGLGTTFTGNMTIGQTAVVQGGDKNLAFFRSSAPGGTTTIGGSGVNTTGNVIVSAGGGAIVSEGGTVSGNQVQLRASQGIGSTLARVRTEASRLAVNNTGSQGAFVSELNDVTLGNVNLTVGGNANNVSNTIGNGGNYDLQATGSITLTDLLHAGGVTLTTTTGSITETGAGAIAANTLTTSSAQSTLLTGANQVSTLNAVSGNGLAFTNTGDLTFSGTAGTGDIDLVNTGTLTVSSLFARNADVDNHGAMTVTGSWSTFGNTSVATTGPGADLAVLGQLTSSGSMDLDVAGTLRVAASGLQNVFVQSSGGQNITAGAVEVTAGNGRVAQIVNFAGDQTITATTGGVDVQASGPGSFAAIQNQAGIRQTVNAAGGVRMLSQAGGGTQIGNAGSGDQTITISSGGLSMIGEGGNAAIANTSLAGGNQRITVAGGSGIDMRSTGGGGTSLGQVATGRSQTILVTDADHISLNGVNGSAAITANGGTQTVSITGSGANAISLGSAGALGSSQIVGGSQNVTAGAEGQSGSITITGANANGRFAGLSTQTVADGTQSVSTSGLLRVTGGNASAQNLSAGLFHAGSGAQTVNAARIELEGGAAGNGNGALIVSSGGNVPANAGAQNINVSGDLIIAGGAGGNAGITGPAARLQTIRAANIHMTNSAAGGNNSVGFILGGHQDIGVTGDLTMTARASGGDLPGVRIGGLSGAAATATDLMLTVGGDLILTGGTVAGNGVGIGSTAAPGPAFANHITINTGGDVILNSGTVSGTAVRIGSSATTGAAEGDIRITAGGDIRLNGVADNAAIRTLGSVTLEAASITEAERGLIEAAALSTRTTGDALLTGPNRVSAFTASSDHGNVHLTNGAPVLTLGTMDLPGNLTVVQTGDIAVGSASATQATMVAAAGDVSMSASGQILVRGSDTTAGAGAAVLAGGDLSFSAGNVSLVAGNAALTPVVVRGANGVRMTVNHELRVTGGGGLLSPTLLTSGGDIDLTIGQAVRVNAGAGLLSIARVQLETRDGVIRLTFPELSHGGYFVNGIEGRTHQGQTGFFSVLRPAKVGRTLLLDYGT